MKKKSNEVKAIKDRSPAEFTEMEQAAILKEMFNNTGGKLDNAQVVDIVGNWCSQTRMFSIILEAALKKEVAIGVSEDGMLTFGILKDGTPAAKLIKELSFKEAVIKDPKGGEETSH